MSQNNMLKNNIKLDKKIIFSISVLLLSIGGLSIGDSFAQTNGIPELLSDVPVTETAQNSELLSDFQAQNSQIEVASSSLDSTIPSDNLIRESKQVYANTSVFDQDTFTIRTFDETLTITKDYTEVKDGYTVWMGSTQDGYNANFVITNGTIQGSINTPEKSYAIGWTGTDTIHTLKDLDLSQLPPEHGEDYDPTADEMGTSDFLQLPSAIRDEIELFANSHIGGHDYRANALTITLVVGYTDAADTELSRNGNTERIIRAAVEDANRTYRDNRLPIVLDLVDNDLVRGYVESTAHTPNTSNLTLDRNNLRGDNGDTSLNGLRGEGLRSNADVVILVTHYPNVDESPNRNSGCGQAGTLFADNIANSIAIVRDICLENNLSLPHEIGHLQGARHNPEVENPHTHSRTNPFSYGHGYFDAAEYQRTVMSYPDASCVDAGHPNGCVRMGVWSDPHDNFFGSVAPTGTEDTNFNAKVLYGSAQHISSLRGDAQRYDDQSPTGFFNWAGLQLNKIFNQGDTMDISATFDEPIHADHPPTVTISDGTLSTPIVMDRTSSTAFTASHDLTTEVGAVTLEFSNAQDLFTNPVTVTATGNSGSVTVNAPDIIPPVITLNPPNPQIIELGDSYTELDATTDDSSPVTIDTSAFNDAVGTYSILYDSVDAANNQATQVVRTVNVVDTTKPIITLTGVTPALEVGVDTYTELGATVTDNDSTYSENVTVGGDTVDTTLVGSYTVTYDAPDDTAQNTPDQVTRVVIVQDTTGPVITLTPPNPQSINQGDTYSELGASCTDIYDGSISNIAIVSNVDTTTVGTYQVTYDCQDAVGNDAIQVVRTVNVLDVTAPVISLDGVTPVQVIQNYPYVDAGASCNDETDGLLSVTVGGLPIDTAIVGTYHITYDCQDTTGNDATQVVRTVQVSVPVDTTSPVITLVGSTPVSVDVGDNYADAGATATDNVDGDITVNIVTVNPVNTGIVGSYTVTYNVSDAAGNDANQVIRAVNVVLSQTPPPVQTEFVIPISQSSDDAQQNTFYQAENANYWAVLDSTEINLVHNMVGLRFDNIPLNQGELIKNVYIQFTSKANMIGATSMWIHGQNDTSPQTFVVSEDIDDRVTQFYEYYDGYGIPSNYVDWDIGNRHVDGSGDWNAEESGVNQQTPNLKLILQKIIDKPNWQNGNSVVFIFEAGHGYSDNEKIAYSSEGNQAKSPKLHITLSTATPPTPGQTEFSIPITQSSDDAEESWSNGVKLDSDDLDLAQYLVGLRFNDIPIRQGQLIESAYIQFTSQATKTTDVDGFSQVQIRGEEELDASPFIVSDDDISDRYTTSAGVNWNIPDWNVDDSGIAQRTPEIKTILQELVNQVDWTRGNSVAFLLEDWGGDRDGYSYDNDPEKAPVLHFTLTNNN